LTAAPATPRHFLYVGDAEPRKNLATLRAAHTRYADRAPEPSRWSEVRAQLPEWPGASRRREAAREMTTQVTN
jgi:hypothetical protein